VKSQQKKHPRVQHCTASVQHDTPGLQNDAPALQNDTLGLQHNRGLNANGNGNINVNVNVNIHVNANASANAHVNANVNFIFSENTKGSFANGRALGQSSIFAGSTGFQFGSQNHQQVEHKSHKLASKMNAGKVVNISKRYLKLMIKRDEKSPNKVPQTEPYEPPKKLPFES